MLAAARTAQPLSSHDSGGCSVKAFAPARGIATREPAKWQRQRGRTRRSHTRDNKARPARNRQRAAHPPGSSWRIVGPRELETRMVNSFQRSPKRTPLLSEVQELRAALIAATLASGSLPRLLDVGKDPGASARAPAAD